MNRTIKATEIRVNDTITYCGATFIAERIERYNGLVTITPQGGGVAQVIADERDVVVSGERGYKVANVHYNQFTPRDTVKTVVGPRTRGEFQSAMYCGNKPNAMSFASSAELVTCDKCHKAAVLAR